MTRCNGDLGCDIGVSRVLRDKNGGNCGGIDDAGNSKVKIFLPVMLPRSYLSLSCSDPGSRARVGRDIQAYGARYNETASRSSPYPRVTSHNNLVW
jgi:hypothetical protein